MAEFVCHQPLCAFRFRASARLDLREGRPARHALAPSAAIAQQILFPQTNNYRSSARVFWRSQRLLAKTVGRLPDLVADQTCRSGHALVSAWTSAFQLALHPTWLLPANACQCLTWLPKPTSKHGQLYRQNRSFFSSMKISISDPINPHKRLIWP